MTSTSPSWALQVGGEGAGQGRQATPGDSAGSQLSTIAGIIPFIYHLEPGGALRPCGAPDPTTVVLIESIVSPGSEKAPSPARRSTQRRIWVAAFIALEDFLVSLGRMEELRDLVRLGTGEVKRQRIDKGHIPKVPHAGGLIPAILVCVDAHQRRGRRMQTTRPKLLPGIDLVDVPLCPMRVPPLPIRRKSFGMVIMPCLACMPGTSSARLLWMHGGASCRAMVFCGTTSLPWFGLEVSPHLL
jgi:hypothetical protein